MLLNIICACFYELVMNLIVLVDVKWTKFRNEMGYIYLITVYRYIPEDSVEDLEIPSAIINSPNIILLIHSTHLTIDL